MTITSKSNETVKKFASLKEKKFRKLYSLFLVEGYKMVREVEKSDFKIEQIVVSQSYKGDYDENNAMVVSDSVFSYISDEKSPQGILAVAQIPQREVCAPKGNCLLLDGISDPGNLGTIVRCANAAGYDEVYLLECTDLYSPKCVRSSMSGIFFTKAYEITREQLGVFDGITVLKADMHGTNVFRFQPPEKFCLAIGSEANGVSEQVRSMSGDTISIPMRSTQESLNAAVSAAICMYALNEKNI